MEMISAVFFLFFFCVVGGVERSGYCVWVVEVFRVSIKISSVVCFMGKYFSRICIEGWVNFGGVWVFFFLFVLFSVFGSY